MKTLFMIKLMVIAAFLFISGSAGAQSSTKADREDTDTSEQYIPVEGKSKTGVPADLQGSWMLVSGMKAVKRADTNLDFENKKLAEGTEMRHDSSTSSTTTNGVTETTTEVMIDKTVAPEKSVTPAQGGKMHTPDKPSISFYGANETFSGFTGCNKYSGRYTIKGSTISLTNASASTKMVCLGEYDEKSFLEALKKVNSFRTNNGQLELLSGAEVLLVFARK